MKFRLFAIYIPIWLDLLSLQNADLKRLKKYLHSNMVRFIILLTELIQNHQEIIYIPIWLDLLFEVRLYELLFLPHLHSNMVRFIMQAILKKIVASP